MMKQIASQQLAQVTSNKHDRLRYLSLSRLPIVVATILLSISNIECQHRPLSPNIVPAREPFRPSLVHVPGNEGLRREAGRVDQVIFPYESFATDQTDYKQTSYIIDHKRFVEPYSTRCLASTLLEDPDSIEPQFVVIRPHSEIRVNATAPIGAIKETGFEPRQRTTIFIHGFTQSYPDTEWLRKARGLFEMHSLVGKQNLIIMDWGVGSHGSYSEVAARASGMGSFLANFLMKLIDMGQDRTRIHIIGHSLGAHVAGFAGKRIRPRLGRVTGLDAAGPCFGKLVSNSQNDRLAPDDAIEVDVYHYDDGFLGISGQVGQFDVLVNGGSSQPGATDDMGSMMQGFMTMAMRRNRPLSESHSRSTEVATSQLSLSGCQMIAYECRSWSAFKAGECGHCDDSNNQCFNMAFNYQYNQGEMEGPLLRQCNPGKQLYIATSSQGLFCLHHFQVVVEFEPSPDLVNQAKKHPHHHFRLFVKLANGRNERSNLTITNMLAPNVFSHLLLSEMPPARFKSAILQIRMGKHNKPVQMRHHEKHKARPYTQPIRVNSIEVNYMSNVSPVIRRGLSSRLCPSGWLEADTIQDSKSEPQDWLTLNEC